MSSNIPSTALVPSGAQGTGGPSFAQQGTVDWVALSQSQWSASIAILGRLSSAGIEPLTVAVGQAICSRISLGIRGEKLLRDSMANLKACSSFGDVVWFGVGVRHILRVLVQTSQGASLVALCAALSESHNLSTSALILSEMTKRSGSPKELTPSFAQWEALVRVCSSTFIQTTLGIRIDQMLRLTGCDLRENTTGLAGHPQDLAEILSAIGKVTSGDLVNIHVVGGPACSWLAVFSDFVLGLRVSVRAGEGRTVFVNFDPSTAQVQIDFEISNGLPEDRIACVGRSFSLRNGASFIRNFIHGNTEPFIGGKLSWSSMLSDTFGAAADNLFNAHPAPSMRDFFLSTLSKPLDQAFTDFFIAGAAFYTQMTMERNRYASIHDFVLGAEAYIRELEPMKQRLLQAASQWNYDGDNLYDMFLEKLLALCELCRCHTHGWSRPLDRPLDEPLCSVVVAETILVVSYLLGQTNIVGSLNPRRAGLLSMYSYIERYHSLFESTLENSSSGRPPTSATLFHWEIKSILIPESCKNGFPGLFDTYMSLFSGLDSSSSYVGKTVSAASDGKIYCFVDSVRELSDCYKTASIVHIGVGTIQFGDRLHYSIFDESRSAKAGYETLRLTAFHGATPEGLALDTTSPELKVEAMVEERRKLTFWYRLYSRRGNILISPGVFVDDLKGANQFRDYWKSLYQHHLSGGYESGDIAGRSLEILTAQGEGTLPNGYKIGSGGIIVRPHHNNTLGRCAAIALSPRPKALINKPEDLDHFARTHYVLEYRSGKAETVIMI